MADTDPVGATPRWVAAALLSVLLSVLLALSASTPAEGAEGLDGEQLGLEVDAGFGGVVVPQASLPITVTMSPTRPFRGQVRLVSDHNAGRQVRVEEIEVPGGSTKVFRFVVPRAHRVEVQVTEAGEGVSVQVPLRPAERYLVGVLDDDVPGNAPPLRAYATDQPGQFVSLASAWLDHPGALSSLSAVLATPEVLEAMSDPARRQLATAVVEGMDLVVTPTRPGTVDLEPLGLPNPAMETSAASGLADTLAVTPTTAAWTLRADDATQGPDVAAVTQAGRGRVAVSGVTPGAGPVGTDGTYWGHLLQPTARTVGGDGDRFDNPQFDPTLASRSLRPESLTVPPIGWIVIFLLAYVVVVGPVNGVVLSRANRRELAWVTVPAVTLVFTAGAWVASADQAPSVGLAGRAAYWIDGQGSEIAVTAVRAPRRDTHEVSLTGGRWQVTTGGFGDASVIRTGGDEVDVELTLEALQVGGVVAERPAQAEPPLDVTATVAGDRVEVEVTNRSPWQLENATLRAGTATERVGTIAAGATETFTLEVGDTLPVRPAWNDPFEGLREVDPDLTAPRSLESLLRFGVLDGAPGVVWVTGTFAPGTESLPVRVGGDEPAGQGSFVAVGTTPAPGDGDVSPFAVDRQLLTSRIGFARRIGSLAIDGQTEAFLRFRLPGRGEVAELTSSLERGELQTGGRDHTCTGSEVVGEDGAVRAREVCGPTQVIGALEDVCPEDAEHCALEETTWIVCREGGCTEQPMPLELQDALSATGSSGLEIYDRDERRWRPLGDVVTDDVIADPDRFVSPLGEIFVRVEGELHPFDYSGRGIAARYRS